MKYGIAFLLITFLSALKLTAEVHYLRADTVGVVPSGRIIAVEARASIPDGKMGAGRHGFWTLEWDDVRIVADFDFRSVVDGIDDVKVKVTCGAQSVLAPGFNCSGGYNTLAVEWGSDGKVRVLGGEDELAPLLELDSLPRPSGQVHIRASGSIDVADLIIETDSNDFDRLMTDYTPEQLSGAIRWRYLDRENDPAVALPGGNYVLAQVGNDLVYMGGARINASLWRAGMLKGRLTPTGYVGYMRLQWYDATGRSLADESYAEMDSTAQTMTLVFPALQARLRFTRLSPFVK